MNTVHLKEQCGYPNCTAEFWAADELRHASTEHGYPACSVCHKTSKSVKMFNKHILTCTDPVIACVLCNEALLQSELREHALSSHGYPECPCCKKAVGDANAPNFLKHVKSCINNAKNVIVCSLCAKDPDHYGEAPMLLCDKRHITEHLVAVHNFTGFACPHCDMGKSTDGIFLNIPVFMQHIANCEYGKTYNCRKCRGVFVSRQFYIHHRNSCVPVGQVGLSFTAYATQLHGSEMDMVCGSSRLRVKWDLSQYVNSLRPLSIPTHLGSLTLLMETDEERIFRETRRSNGYVDGKVDESGGLTGVEGGSYKLYDDPRLFQQVRTSATSHAWLFRLCGTPWELGGGKTSALMMDQRLCLVNYFQKRSAYDVWIYLVSRFCKYTKTMYEVNEVKGLLTNCELPSGVSCQYRDLDFVRMFCGNASMNAEKMRASVKYATRKGNRVVGEEVSNLVRKRKQIVFSESTLPVPVIDTEADIESKRQSFKLRRRMNLDVVETEAAKVEAAAAVELEAAKAAKAAVKMEAAAVKAAAKAAVKMEAPVCTDIEWLRACEEYTEDDESEDTVVLILANPTTVLPADVCLYSGVCLPGGVPVDCVQMADTGSPTGPASIVNAVRAALYALPPHEYAAHVSPACENEELWSDACWEMIYMVYRDFMTYFVKTQSFARLRLFSNFTNDRPCYENLEELLYKFRPFILRDMKLKQVCTRASALFYGLQNEYHGLRNLHKNGLRLDRLRNSTLKEYDSRKTLFLSKTVHRS